MFDFQERELRVRFSFWCAAGEFDGFPIHFFILKMVISIVSEV